MLALQTPAVEEFLASGTNRRGEFVRGQRLEKSMSDFQHGLIQLTLGGALLEYGRRTDRGLPVSEWHHRFGPEDDVRIYVPDLVFLVAPRHKNPPRYGDSAPDLAVEIVSPSQSAAELIDKVEFYLENGVKRVWVVDPPSRRVLTYGRGVGPQRLGESDVLRDEVLLPGFEIAVAKLFGN